VGFVSDYSEFALKDAREFIGIFPKVTYWRTRGAPNIAARWFDATAFVGFTVLSPKPRRASLPFKKLQIRK